MRRERISVNIRIWCQVRSDCTQQRCRCHHAESADHAFRDQQSRSQNITAKAQRHQRRSDEAGNDDGASELERQPTPRRNHAADSRTDRKSTRLNSSHSQISYAVFCLKKKNLLTQPPKPGQNPTLPHQRFPPSAQTWPFPYFTTYLLPSHVTSLTVSSLVSVTFRVRAT